MKRVQLIEPEPIVFSNSAFPYTEGQKDCISYVVRNINRKTTFSIRGNAGTGKSTAFVEIVRQLRSRGHTVRTCALTHKAASLLSRFVSGTTTVHSLFGLLPEVDYRTGVETYKPIGKPKVTYGDIVLVDEASMNGTVLFALLTAFCRTHNIRFIFFGDQFQLPPVGEDLSPALFLKGAQALTEVVRHDSEILEFATACCEAVKVSRAVSVSRFANKKNIHLLRRPEFDEVLNSAMTRAYPVGGIQNTDDAKFVAWTNRTVDRRATEIREMLGRTDVPEAHEVLTVAATYQKHDVVLYQNNEEVTLSLVQEDVLEVEGHFLHGVYCTTTKYPDQKHFAPTDKKAVQLLLRSIGKRCEEARHWGPYFAVKNQLLYLAYPQTCTVHKSQGSTYKDVFVDLRDLRSCIEIDLYARLLYVSVSRATDNVYLLR